jgi:hypothetical protein
LTDTYAKEPECIRELREIRLRISDDIKNMTGKEMREYFRKQLVNFEKETGKKYKPASRTHR